MSCITNSRCQIRMYNVLARGAKSHEEKNESPTLIKIHIENTVILQLFFTEGKYEMVVQVI